jgi:hypothetical protein
MKKFKRLALLALMPLAAVMMGWGMGPECPPDNGGYTYYFPNPDDCTTFWICEYGSSFLLHCPDGLLWCPEQQTCSWAWEINCNFGCTKGGGYGSSGDSGSGGGGGNYGGGYGGYSGGGTVIDFPDSDYVHCRCHGTECQGGNAISLRRNCAKDKKTIRCDDWDSNCR